MAAIGRLWSDYSGLQRYNEISAVDTRVRHAMTMFAVWSSFSWLTKVIEAAVSSLPALLKMLFPQRNWIQNLVCDLSDAHHSKTATRQYSVNPSRYFQNNSTMQPTTINLKRFTLRPEVNLDRIRDSCRFLLKTWLTFPSDISYEFQYHIMECFIQYTPSNAFFMLSETWILFQNPLDYLSLTHGNRRRIPASSEVYDLILPMLEHHPIFVADSQESSILDTLDYLLHLWTDKNGPAHQLPSPKARTVSKHVSASRPLPDASDDVRTAQNHVFLLWLRRVASVLRRVPKPNDTFDVVLDFQGSKDAVVKKIATRPDFYLPFRERAPARQRVISTVYGNQQRLRSAEGFWGVLAYRGVFYGSEFARHHDCNFADFEAWSTFKANSDKPDAYFVDKNAYGTAISQRSLDRLSEYWDDRESWMALLGKHPGGLTFEVVYDFLSQHRPNSNFGKPLPSGQKNPKGKTHSLGPNIDVRKTTMLFHSIGSLNALLICGDLAMAGIVNMPTKLEMGDLIFKLNKGVRGGLMKLGMIGEYPSANEVINAFVSLCDYLEQHLTDEEKETMGYSTSMVEHACCKFKRLFGVK